MSHSRSRLALSLCLITWLFTIGTAVAEREVNDTFIPPGPVISGQSYDSTPATDAPVGTFSFTATFCNSHGADMTHGLESRTVTLTNSNVLLNRNMSTSTAPGVGSRLNFLAAGDYSDLSLLLNECVPVEYRIGLQTSDQFQFLVDVWLAPPVVLSMSAPSAVLEGQLVHLHAAMSPLDTGEIPTFAWLQDSGPLVTLTDAATANPSFTSPGLKKPTTPTTLRFKVTATLNGKSQEGFVDVVVNTGNIVVDAGPDQSAVVGHAVNLHVVSTPVARKWEWVQTLGDPVILTKATTANPSFTAPATVQGLEFEARTKIGPDTGADRVVVTIVRKTALMVHAGGDLNAVSGQTVTLNCTVDGGTPTTQGWSQVDNGAPSQTLSDADTLTATFKPVVTLDTTFEFKCSASGPDGNAEDRLTVTVTPPTNPLSVDAGLDQDVLEGDTVHLHGAGSGGTGDILSLGYAWVETTNVPISITDADTQTPSFVAPDVGGDTAVTLEVTVTDQASATASDSVTYTVKERTVTVSAGADQHAVSGGDVHLSAQPVGGMPPYIYTWTQTAGTTVTLNNADTDNPDFTAPSITADETLTFEVEVVGALGNTATDSVNVLIKAPARPLAAHAGSDLSVQPTKTAALHGTATGGAFPYTYSWSSVPPVTLSPSATDPNPTFTQPDDGDVTLTLAVTDSDGATANDEVIVKKVVRRHQATCGTAPGVICDQLWTSILCPIDKPWGLLFINNLIDGRRITDRRCAGTQECFIDWWRSSSDDDKCTTYRADTLLTYAFDCTYCFGGENANAGHLDPMLEPVRNPSGHNTCDTPPPPGKKSGCVFEGSRLE